MGEPRVIRDRIADAYELHDRRFDGYCGRWRYRVSARFAGGRREPLALFTSRAAAAAFNSKCAAFGEAFAYRIHARQMAPKSPLHAAPSRADVGSANLTRDA